VCSREIVDVPAQHKIRKLDCLIPLLAVNGFAERLVAGAAEMRELRSENNFRYHFTFVMV
jgi:hypothetical protein